MSEIKVPLMVTIKEASMMSGLSYDAIRKLCMSNQVKHIRVGCKYFVNWNRFVEFLNEGSEQDA